MEPQIEVLGSEGLSPSPAPDSGSIAPSIEVGDEYDGASDGGDTGALDEQRATSPKQKRKGLFRRIRSALRPDKDKAADKGKVKFDKQDSERSLVKDKSKSDPAKERLDMADSVSHASVQDSVSHAPAKDDKPELPHQPSSSSLQLPGPAFARSVSVSSTAKVLPPLAQEGPFGRSKSVSVPRDKAAKHTSAGVDTEDKVSLASAASSGLGCAGVDEHALHGIRVHLKDGEGLLACDNTGFSDPYCKFKIGKFSKHRSATKKQTLTPVWAEEFFMACPSDFFGDLIIDVFDWDGFSRDDYMGSVVIDLATVSAVPTTKPYQLQNTGKKPMPENLGMIRLSLSRSVEAPKKGLLQRLYSAPIASRLISIDVVEARHVPEDLGDLYVQLKISRKKLKTKIASGGKTVSWRQRCEFAIEDYSQTLTVQLCRADVSSSRDKLVGQAEIDLAAIPYNAAQDVWHDLAPALASPGTDTAPRHPVQLHLQVTVSDLYCESVCSANSGHVEGDRTKKAVLDVEVKAARTLRRVGRSEPFVVLQLGNSRLRTHTLKTTAASWDKSFSFEVGDVFDSLEVSVHDDLRKDTLGRCVIPLQKIDNGLDEWFVLKDNTLLKRTGGELQLKLTLTYSMVTAAKQLVSRRQQRYISDAESFKLSLMKLHVARVKNIILFVIGCGEAVDGLFAWKFGPGPTIASMLLFLLLCLYGDWFVLPLLLLAPMLYFLLLSSHVKLRMNFDERQFDMFADGPDVDDDDDDVDSDKEEVEKKSVYEKWNEVSRLATIAQNGLDSFASFFERVKNLLLWTTPLISGMVCAALLAGSIVLYLIPLRYILLLVGMKKFVKKGLQHYGRLKRGQSTNEVVELVSRLPSDLDVVRARQPRSLRRGNSL